MQARYKGRRKQHNGTLGLWVIDSAHMCMVTCRTKEQAQDAEGTLGTNRTKLLTPGYWRSKTDLPVSKHGCCWKQQLISNVLVAFQVIPK